MASNKVNYVRGSNSYKVVSAVENCKLWCEFFYIKNKEGIVDIYTLIPYSTKEDKVLKYKVKFRVRYMGTIRKYERIASVINEENKMYSFVFEGEMITFTTKEKYQKK